MGVECDPRLSCRGSSVTPPSRPDGSLFYCRTTIDSTAPSSPRRTRCPTHLSLPLTLRIERNTLTKERARRPQPHVGLGWRIFLGKRCRHHPDEPVGVLGLLQRLMWALHSPHHGQARIQPVLKSLFLLARQGIERSTLAVEIGEDSVNEKVTARFGQIFRQKLSPSFKFSPFLLGRESSALPSQWRSRRTPATWGSSWG